MEPMRVRHDRVRPGAVLISDTTLRAGEKMPGVAFSPDQKLEIARQLHGIGVAVIEAGYPALCAQDAAAITRIVDDAGGAQIRVVSRPVDHDIDAALATGAPSVAVFLGTSPAQLSAKLRMTQDQALRAVDRAVRRAKRAGRHVVFAAQDAPRTSSRTLLRFCTTAADAGADALGLSDSVGIATPHSMAAMVAAVVDGCPLPITVHCYNDLGLATANSLAGLGAGASAAQCSVLGIGERAGDAPLEQIALALHAAQAQGTGLDLRGLQPLAEYVASLVGHPIPPSQPVVGANAFTHDAGLHLDGVTRDPRAGEPYDPALVGRSRRIVLGKYSGVVAVLAAARSSGVELDAEQARGVLGEVRSASPR